MIFTIPMILKKKSKIFKNSYEKNNLKFLQTPR